VPLNAKQRAFVREYLVDSNATQAAIRAGYSKKTAASQGHYLLRKVDISEEVRKGIGKLEAKVGLTAEECFGILAVVARTGERDSDRVKATESLLKLQHKVSEKVEHTGSVSISVVNPYSKGPADG
jgi:phage terminase small subunit